jgi:hypothetical protein
MLEDFDIQHDQPGFEADGRPVPIVLPEVYNEPPANDAARIDAGQLLNALLIIGKNDGSKPELAKIGEMVLLLGYETKSEYGAKNLRELGNWLGCSHVAARDKLNRLKAVFAREVADF